MPELGLLIGVIATYIAVCISIIFMNGLRERRENKNG
jgi:hypothetical protein